MKYCSMRKEKTSLTYRDCLSKIPREIWQHLTVFSIKKNDNLMLLEYLQLSENNACCERNRFDHIVALCILWRKDFSILTNAKTWSYRVMQMQQLETMHLYTTVLTCVNGTMDSICRPVLNERVVYSHHIRVHGVKF